MMRWIEEEKRTIELKNQDIGSFGEIDRKIQDEIGYIFPPIEGIVIDEDMCSLTLIQRLRSIDLSYRNHSYKSLTPKNNIEVISSAHIFKTTEDKALLKWCDRHGYPLVTCNHQDFLDLHIKCSHSGIIVNTANTSRGFKDYKMADTIQNILSDNSKLDILNEIFPISVSP